jgi:5'/3'-nucleotidase SurE
VNVRSSGTVGAAFEAVAAGINALAVSVEYIHPTNWEATKHYARKVAQMMLALPPGGDPFVLNLNVPSANPEDVKGLVLARHGSGGVRDSIVVEERGGVFHLEADWIATPSEGNCDASAFLAGYAVLTPLRFEMTDDRRMAFLAGQWAGEAALFRGIG